MKRISIITLVALTLMGCNASSASESANGTNSTVNSDFGFLKKLGYDIAKFTILDGEYDPATIEANIVEMNDTQINALLKEVAEPFRLDDGDIEGVFDIVGIRALPGDHTLILYHVEFGDGGVMIFAIYDRNGNTTDYLDTGNWRDMHGEDANDDYTAGKSIFDKAKCNFSTPSSMLLHRDLAFCEWKNNKDGDIKITRELWKITKEYDYTITDEGTFKLNGIDSKESGAIDEKMVILDKLNDLTYLPLKDNSVFDRLNTLAQRSEVKREIADPEGMAQYRAQGILQSAFNMQPQALLQWMSQHRDLSKNAVTGIFEQCFSSGWIPKEKLVDEIEKMKDANAREYLEDLTAQWGPADAVG